MGRDVRGDTGVLDLISEIFERRGTDVYLGEAVTVAEHMLQTAALARADDASDALVTAALLHDIGHFLGALGEHCSEDGVDQQHELAGAAALENHFPAEVTEAVRLHVAAKRYLCAVEPEYQDQLSPASVKSLLLQGGAMTPVEIDQFTSLRFHENAVRVRRWDDSGKLMGQPTPTFGSFRPLLQRVIASNRPPASA